jgi:hypothetical protein
VSTDAESAKRVVFTPRNIHFSKIQENLAASLLQMSLFFGFKSCHEFHLSFLGPANSKIGVSFSYSLSKGG